MHVDTYEMLNKITQHLCGDVPLEIIFSDTLVKRNQTACVVYPYLEKAYIRIHENEIYNTDHKLEERGFSKGYLILEVLLHEICHYKQYRKFIRKRRILTGFRYQLDNNRRKDYHEEVADRYAHYTSKIIVKDIYNMKEKIASLTNLTG